MIHKPVLTREVIELLDPCPGKIFIDATVDGGGHFALIYKTLGARGTMLGIDMDCTLIDRLEAAYQHETGGVKTIFACGNFRDIVEIATMHHIEYVDGILFDLGFSSYHVEQSGRGFSFLREEPLDMRYAPDKTDITAEIIVNEWSKEQLVKTFHEYGEERFARRIANAIDDIRRKNRIRTTTELVNVIFRGLPRAHYRKSRIHPATRVFQALRIAVNNELENIRRGLDGASRLLKTSGVMAVISFHSLEDRIVKEYFKQEARAQQYMMLTKKPIRADVKEITENPRARSARLRAIKRFKN